VLSMQIRYYVFWTQHTPKDFKIITVLIFKTDKN
jgi:hypothetical protein